LKNVEAEIKKKKTSKQGNFLCDGEFVSGKMESNVTVGVVIETGMKKGIVR
jgi:hypothetical protein